MQKPAAREIADPLTNNCSNHVDGVVGTNELGKLSNRIGLEDACCNDGGLIDKEKLISRFSEKMEKVVWSPKMRGFKMYGTCMREQFLAAIGKKSPDTLSGTPTGSDADPVDTISETPTGSEPEPVDALSGTPAGSDAEPVDALSGTPAGSDADPVDALSGTPTGSDADPVDTISDALTGPDADPVDTISETLSIDDLVKQILSKLDLSEEETESFLETMKNYGINVAA